VNRGLGRKELKFSGGSDRGTGANNKAKRKGGGKKKYARRGKKKKDWGWAISFGVESKQLLSGVSSDGGGKQEGGLGKSAKERRRERGQAFKNSKGGKGEGSGCIGDVSDNALSYAQGS